MDAAVGIDDIMIADVVPAEALMVAADAFDGAVGIGSGGGAMDDDFGDCSHFFVGLMGLMGLMGVFGLRRCRSIRNNRMDRGDRYDRVLERGRGWILAPALSGLVKLGGGEVEDVDGVAFGVVGGVFESEFSIGDGVVGGRLHQSVDEDPDGTFAIGRFGEGDFGGEVHAVNGEDRRIGEGNVFLRGHDLAVGEGEAYNGLGGGASTGGVRGVDTCDREGGLGDLDGGAFFGDGRYILACFSTAAGDGLECAAHSVAYGVVNLFTCCGGGGQLVGQR